jgi:hypothetical protein
MEELAAAATTEAPITDRRTRFRRFTVIQGSRNG